MRKFSISLFGQMDRKLAVVEDIDSKSSEDGAGPLDPIKFGVEAGEANLVTSHAYHGDQWHYPVLDLDFHVALAESSTPGQYHLYLNKLVAWDKYVAVLEAMGDAGLLQPGYVDASKKRGHTAVRLPWVRKGHWKKGA